MSKLLKSKILLAFMIVAAVAVVGVSSTLAYTHTVTLKQGSSGSQVVALQSALGGLVADGSFGAMTKAAVVSFQSANGLTADGVVGAMTGAKLSGAPIPGNYPSGCTSAMGYSTTTGASCAVSTTSYPAGCTSTVGYSSTTGAKCDGGSTTVTGPLAGTNGTISDVNQISSYNNEELGDGSKDVKVMGFDVVASNDGDISISSIKLTFDAAGNSGSTRLDDYLTTVKVLNGSTVVATADTADFTKDSTGVYSKTMSLSNVVVKAKATSKFYVAVDAVSNLDSGDISSDSWTVAINNIRYVDGGGVTTTVSSTDSVLTGNMDYDNAGDGVGMSFVSFSTSADTELKISKDTSSPDSQVVKVSADNQTDKVVLLKGKMQLKGTSDVWLDEVPFDLTTNATNVDAVASTYYLTIDGKEYSESLGAGVGTTEPIYFDNLDLDISAGSTIAFTLSADVNDIDVGTFDEGKTLMAELTSTLRDASHFVAENAQGDALADATEKTGSALGEAQAFYSKGIMVSLGSVSASVTTAGDAGATTPTSDIGTFKITFSVTAFGDDMRLDDDAAEDTSAFDTVTQLSYSLSGDASVAATTASLTSSTGATHDTESYLIEEDQTETFTLTVAGTATADVFTNVKLEGLGWTAGSTDAVGANIYTFNLDDFKTADLYLNDN